MNIKQLFLDFIFPIECLGCGKENEWLCQKCLGNIAKQEIDKCPVCKNSSLWGATHLNCQNQINLDGVIVAAKFQDKLLDLAIHQFKYNFIKNLGVPLSKLLIEKINEQKENPLWRENLIVIPIPLHKRRLNWRGFNQAEELAHEIAKEFSLEMIPNILARQKYTKTQAKFSRAKRLTNLQNAFQIQKIKPTNYLLVDDVFTTGATMNECAHLLKKNGAIKVWGIVLARG